MRTLPSSDNDHITFESLYTSPSGWVTNRRGDIVCAMPFLPSFLGLFPVWLLLWRATGSRLFPSALLSSGGPGCYRFWEVLGGVHTRGGYSRSPLVPTRGIAHHVTMMANGHHGLPPWWVHREACCSVQRGSDSGVCLIEDLFFCPPLF